jgi:hypothetical protein
LRRLRVKASGHRITANIFDRNLRSASRLDPAKCPPTANQRLNAQIKRQLAEFENDPQAKAQAALDARWQMMLDLREIDRAPSRRGEYSPIRRLESELDDAQERADELYRRQR